MKGHLKNERMEWKGMKCSNLVGRVNSLGRKGKGKKMHKWSTQHSTEQHSSEDDKGIGTEEKKRRVYVRQCPTPLVRWSHNTAAVISVMLLTIIVIIVHYT